MKNPILYHGSKVDGIKVFEPKAHFISPDKSIVFATDDMSYALAMIYGTGEELAVSYAFNSETNKKEMYVDELQPGKLALLENAGYLYEVDSKYFESSPEGLEGEYVSYSSVPVLLETRVENIVSKLKEFNVNLINYDNVLESMKSRGKKLSTATEYHPDRFKE